MVVKQYEVGNFAVFCYLIGDEETQEGLFIDPADDAKRLLSAAKSQGLNKIKYIVNTHSHVDHIMGNAEMAKKTGAKLVVHEEDAPGLSQTPSYLLEMFGATPSPPADITVREGDIIQVGSVKLKVLHTPGHSPGGMSLYMDGMVFTGDTLFVGSVGRTDFPGSSWDVLEASIRKKLYVLPGETVVFPGHNYGSTPTSTIQYERRHNPFVKG
ncbi:MAG TPA: MBL fold metallo-hydrolase [Thermodesulfobacteriota bacterium]|jgi:glyoxylase-like metal-dependent hydrolase (beta-lactamase superfamily II)|nr:MBL fold metallo-hydrolase [Thermodesulfobacteriota bacterium]